MAIKKIVIPDFCGGLVGNVSDYDIHTKINELKSCKNYEIRQDGILEKRQDLKEFDEFADSLEQLTPSNIYANLQYFWVLNPKTLPLCKGWNLEQNNAWTNMWTDIDWQSAKSYDEETGILTFQPSRFHDTAYLSVASTFFVPSFTTGESMRITFEAKADAGLLAILDGDNPILNCASSASTTLYFPEQLTEEFQLYSMTYEEDGDGGLSLCVHTNMTTSTPPTHLYIRNLKMEKVLDSDTKLPVIKDYLILAKANDNIYLFGCIIKNDLPFWNFIYQESDVGLPLFTDVGSNVVVCQTTFGFTLVDGRDNSIVKYIEIDADGELFFGKLGLESPITLLNGSDAEYTSDSAIDKGMGVIRGSILFYAYSFEKENGEISNPSPISVIADDNKLYKDDDSVLEQFTKKITLTPFGENADAKFINLYRSSIPYTEDSLGRSDFTLVHRYMINESLNDTSGPGIILLNYDNDVDVKGDDVCAISGVTFIANANSAIKFPFDFEHYIEIEVDNTNTRNYVNGVYVLKIDPTDAIFEINGANVFPLSTLLMYKNKVRFFDIDLRTPLPVVYYKYNDSCYFFYIKIPYLNADYKHSIYLTWVNDGSQEGVTNPSWQYDNSSYTKGEYGEFLNVETSNEWAGQKVFSKGGVRSSDVLASLDMETSTETGDVPNIADINAPFHRDGTIPVLTYDACFLLNFGDFYRAYGDFSYAFGTSTQLYANKDNLLLADIHSVYGYFHIMTDDALEYSSNHEVNVIYSNTSSSSSTARLFALYFKKRAGGSGGILGFFFGDEGDSFYQELSDDTFELNSDAFIFLSFRNNGDSIDLSIKILLPDGSLFFEQVSHVTESYDRQVIGLRAGLDVYYHTLWNFNTMPTLRVSSLNLINNFYTEDIAIIQNIYQFRPIFSSDFIGCKFSEIVATGGTMDEVNHNITFGEIKEIKFDSEEGVIRYSSLGGKVFPDTQRITLSEKILKLVPMPYHMNLDRINALFIFTASGMFMFKLMGSVQGWSGFLTENMLQEQVGDALLSPQFMEVAKNTIYWGADTGINVYVPGQGDSIIISDRAFSPEELQNYDYVGIYIPIRKQIWFHSQRSPVSDSVTLVYDLRRKIFLKFEGLDILCADQVISENKMLFLSGDEGSRKLNWYPDPESVLVSSASLTTHKIPLNGICKLRKAKSIFENSGSAMSSQIAVENEYYDDGEQIESITLTNKTKSRLPLIEGENVQITIDNVEKIMNYVLEVIE